MGKLSMSIVGLICSLISFGIYLYLAITTKEYILRRTRVLYIFAAIFFGVAALGHFIKFFLLIS